MVVIHFCKSTKSVFVELINCSINRSYDIVLLNHVEERDKRNDLEKMCQVLQHKSTEPTLSRVFQLFFSET